jgi:NAD dependent epimerase/dehydratase
MKITTGTKVLITGADGFIGSHLTELLVRNGAQVRALSNYNSFNHWGWLEDLGCLNDVDVVCGDIRDPFFCEKIADGIDVIFHLAALIAIPFSYIAPATYIETNVQGTLNICNAALKNGCSRLVQTSTSEVYGTARYVPIDEEHPLQPQSPYSASKIGADMVARSFYHSYQLPVVVARPFNTYGPRQSARAVIPTIITQIAAGATGISLGDTRPTRDFNYVEDTCRGFLALAECDQAVGDTVNIGSNREISVGDTFGLIAQLMGRDVKLIQSGERIRPAGSEVHRLWCDNSKIEKLTGHKPQVPLEEGLKRTIDWFTRPVNLAKYKAGIYNV